MQKSVKRSSVSVTIESKSTGEQSALKKDSSLSLGDLPDANSLRSKYGLSGTTSNTAEPSTAAVFETFDNTSIEKTIEALQFELAAKNRKIEQLSIILEAVKPSADVSPDRIQRALQQDEGVDLRDSKIVSLAKKSHNLTMQLNKERSVNERLRTDLDDMVSKTAQLMEELETLRASTSAFSKIEDKVYNRHTLQAQADKAESESAVLSLNKQLRESQRAVDELKRKTKELTDENKHLSRCLAKELGEGESLEIIKDPSWRGRAQTIVMLKAKVKSLESQLFGQNTDSRTVDSKAEENIQEMVRERRQVVEALTEERLQLIDQVQTLDKKSNSYKARIQILEGETRRLKENLQVALDKSLTDDQLLDALKAEVQRLSTLLKRQQEAAESRKESNAKSSISTNSVKVDQYESEIRRLERLVRHQGEQLDSQDRTIRELRKQLGTT